MKDRLLLLSGALLAYGAVAFAVDLVHPIVPPLLLWLPSVLGGVVPVLIYRRTARTPGLPSAVGRFWRQLAVVGALAAAGELGQATDVLAHPDVPGQHVGPAMQIFDSACVLVIVYALYRLPLAKQTRAERVRVILDAGTVMLATALFMWHFQTRQALTHATTPSQAWASLGLTVFALVAVFAVCKVMLAGETFVDAGALRLFAGAILVGTIGPLLRDYLEPYRPHVFPEPLSMSVVFFVAALAGERQRRADTDARPRPAKGRRPFSLFPYLAVAGVDSLLLTVPWLDRPEQITVIVFAVVLTGVVVLRQLLAFRENGRLLERLDHVATHDALTQLPNRVLFHQRLQAALTAPGDRPVSVALIDLDDFKEVNDTLGHEVGDQLLVAVADRLAASMRAGDTVARLGGDEFVLVLDDADRAAADQVADRIVDALRAPVSCGGQNLPIRASIGIADGRAGDEPSVLLRRADIAMYAAKKLPGTAYLHFTAEPVEVS